MSGCNLSLLLNPKAEPRTQDDNSTTGSGGRGNAMDELEELLSNSEDEYMVVGGGSELEWDFMGWEEHYSPYDGPKEGEDGEAKNGRESLSSEVPNFGIGIKEENRVGFWEQNNLSLNLSLNYQDVMDAWSDRGPLLADHHHCSIADAKHSNSEYAGEAPTMEDKEEGERRRARVLKYREKRHNRLFSKTIRYAVRKINAEKKPRLKGRFVKRNAEKIMLR